MKIISYIVLVLVGVLFLASAEQSNAGQPKDSRSVFATSLADGGRVRMKHSPVLGINITIAIRIDGMNAGAFSKGHVYEKYPHSRPAPGRCESPRSGVRFVAWHAGCEAR